MKMVLLLAAERRCSVSMCTLALSMCHCCIPSLLTVEDYELLQRGNFMCGTLVPPMNFAIASCWSTARLLIHGPQFPFLVPYILILYSCSASGSGKDPHYLPNISTTAKEMVHFPNFQIGSWSKLTVHFSS